MKINAIILAAGNSTRFKGNKLLACFKDKPLIIHTVEAITSVAFQEIIIVTQYTELTELIKSYPITIIKNDAPDLGITHSIRLGIETSRACDAYMFFVGDQPFITSELIEGMIEAFERSEATIFCAGYKETKGNPTLFASRYKEELLGLTGDIGGKQVITKHHDQVEIYQVKENQIIQDIDTQKDYKELLKREK